MSVSRTRPLSQAEILREAALIWKAINVKPDSPRAEILSPLRELAAADEDRVVLALEDMALSES